MQGLPVTPAIDIALKEAKSQAHSMGTDILSLCEWMKSTNNV